MNVSVMINNAPEETEIIKSRK